MHSSPPGPDDIGGAPSAVPEPQAPSFSAMPAARPAGVLAPRNLAVAGAIAVGLLGWQTWSLHREIDLVQRELARRVDDAGGQSSAAAQSARQSADLVADLSAKLSLIEARVGESQAQQQALEQLYQELARNRDDIQLAEIEQVLATAAQQLELAGNVQAALVALQTVDARLAQGDRPQFLAVRRAVARDIERLKALPATDVTGLAFKLDQAIASVDDLPTLAEVRPADKSAAEPPKPNADYWTQLAERVANEARDLFRIRQVSQPDALLLTPSQSYFARENLKLRLLNARLRLLARNEAGYRADLAVGSALLHGYFDDRARPVLALASTLRQLQAAEVSIDLPNLNESLNAVRNYRPSAPVTAPAPRAEAGKR
ncbi:uroporphyrinogen-III C-methyltransferase [Derxia gummosa]|uniref:Uroporphyrinogen-III C-methyltransferase n=1 Tax=Derxia gummosa DSM 723 TaxID=1121388 RepID=A0A8B6XBD1_9BURK|nr:uroporphyrinogen-III C-methyltransferase [Derxia gummosa]